MVVVRVSKEDIVCINSIHLSENFNCSGVHSIQCSWVIQRDLSKAPECEHDKATSDDNK